MNRPANDLWRPGTGPRQIRVSRLMSGRHRYAIPAAFFAAAFLLPTAALVQNWQASKCREPANDPVAMHRGMLARLVENRGWATNLSQPVFALRRYRAPIAARVLPLRRIARLAGSAE